MRKITLQRHPSVQLKGLEDVPKDDFRRLKLVEASLIIDPPPEDLPVHEVLVVHVMNFRKLIIRGWGRKLGTEAYDVPVQCTIVNGNLAELFIITPAEVGSYA